MVVVPDLSVKELRPDDPVKEPTWPKWTEPPPNVSSPFDAEVLVSPRAH
jgi:hypothetical protein